MNEIVVGSAFKDCHVVLIFLAHSRIGTIRLFPSVRVEVLAPSLAFSVRRDRKLNCTRSLCGGAHEESSSLYGVWFVYFLHDRFVVMQNCYKTSAAASFAVSEKKSLLCPYQSGIYWHPLAQGFPLSRPENGRLLFERCKIMQIEWAPFFDDSFFAVVIAAWSYSSAAQLVCAHGCLPFIEHLSFFPLIS